MNKNIKIPYILDDFKSNLTFKQKVEQTPEVQEILNKDLWEEIYRLVKAPTMHWPTPWVPHTILKKRNDYIVWLYGIWLSTQTIINNSNKRAEINGWGRIHTEKSIKRIISKYYNNQSPSTKNIKFHNEWMREATFAQQTLIMENMAIKIQNRKQWRPFEEIKAMEALYRMRQQMIENRNFNMSNRNYRMYTTPAEAYETNKEKSKNTFTSPALDKLKKRLAEKFNKE